MPNLYIYVTTRWTSQENLDSITTLTANVANVQTSITTFAIKVNVLTKRVDEGQEDVHKNFEDSILELNHLRLRHHDPNSRDLRMDAVDRDFENYYLLKQNWKGQLVFGSMLCVFWALLVSQRKKDDPKIHRDEFF